jgi:two-component system, OmpR family, alkaline phosphatase synthesis response regulator PhoP
VERILVIYDDPGLQRTVRQILEPAGYDVTIAASDQIATDVIRTTNAGLVILDVCLPSKSTQDLCRQIRNKSENVSILVLSPITHVEEVVLFLKLGADGYITKPFNPLEFMARVRAAMRRRGNF